MTDSSADRDPLERLAEEFVTRYRAGQRPALAEYAERLPDRADEVRELFPALVEMEQFKPAAGDHTGDYVPAVGPSDPARLGEFRILRRVGVGGMGVVYEAVQESLGRHVALKLLPLEALADPKRLERFRREAKSAARLHHTNIVPVFGVGEADGRHYYAMQFIAGHPLDAVIDEVRRLKDRSAAAPGAPAVSEIAAAMATGTFPARPPASGDATAERAASSGRAPIPPAEPPAVSGSLSGGRGYWSTVARLAAQVADALAYAHGQGVLHRDVKPANLLLDLHGTVWVTDFGLAKSNDADGLTHAGDIVGTLRYMAPERFEGAGDHRADVYALGLTLYELLTLKPAFAASTRAKLVEQAIAADPAKPRSVNPAIPRDLETVVLKAVARDPAARYQSAAELGEDLRRYLEDRPIRARRATASEQAWRWCRRNPLVASLVGALGLLLLAGAMGGAAAAARFKDQADVALRAKRDADEARREVGVQLWRSQLNEARANTRSGLPGQRFGSLALLKTALAAAGGASLADDDRKRFRDVAAAALALPDLEVLKDWDGYPTGTYHVAFDARFERYARVANNGAVTVRRIEDDAELFALPATGLPAYLALSDSGKVLTVSDVGGATPERGGRVYSLDGSAPVLIHQAAMAHGRNVYVSPADRRVCYVVANTLKAWNRESGQTESWPLPGTHSVFAALSRDGRRMAVPTINAGGAVLHVRDVTTGQTVADLRFPREIHSCAWHPNGRVVAVAQQFTIHVWDVEAKRELVVFGKHAYSGVMVSFDAAGERLISNDWGGVLRLWNWRAGKELLNLASSFHMHARLVSADGRLVVHGQDSRKLRLLRHTPGLERRQFTPAGAVANNLRLDPAGRLAIMSPADQKGLNGFRVLDASTGAVRAEWSASEASAFHISTDGSVLTHGNGGIVRWPRSEPAAGIFRLGPPQRLLGNRTHNLHAASADGRVVAVPDHQAGALALHADSPSLPVRLGPQENVVSTAVSPDGRFVATGNHVNIAEIGVRVWDARTGAQLAAFRIYGGPLWFSPDSRWLATGGKGGVRLWRTESWTAGPELPDAEKGEYCVFSPDSMAIAVGGHAELRLVRVADGAELVQLPCAVRAKYVPQCFAPDGSRLYALDQDSGEVVVWDLRALRAGLAELGLDWDAPPLPPAAAEPTPPRSVEIVGADLLVDARKMAGRQRLESAALWALNPFDAGPYARWGSAALEAGFPFAARVLCDAALAIDPARIDARLPRARAFLRMNDFAHAAADATAILDRFPTQLATRRLRAAAYRELGRPAETAADLSVILRYAPDDVSMLLERAEALRAAGEFKTAAADLERLGRFAGNAEASNAAAWYFATGPVAGRNPQRALEFSARVVAAHPNNALYLNTLGVAQYRNELYSEAAATLEKSLAAGKGANAGFDLYVLAMCRHRLGDRARAKECFDRAAKWSDTARALTRRERTELDEFRREAATMMGLK